MTLFWDNGITRFHQGDARSIPLPDQSVHCVVTSPPYFGLRDYRLPTTIWGGNPACVHTWEAAAADTEVGIGNQNQAANGRGESQPESEETGSCSTCGAWRGSLGLEPDVGQYISHLSQVFEEVRRLLRNDGVFWVNIGDSHMGGRLAGIPERLVFALEDSGWMRRQTVVWDKEASMPESVQGTRWERCRVKIERGAPARHGHAQEHWRLGTNPGNPQQGHDGRDFRRGAEWNDCSGCAKCEANGGYVLRRGSWRCTTGHEYIYMFTKKMGYYADGVPVATPLRPGTIARSAQNDGHPRWEGNVERQSTQVPQEIDISKMAPTAGANRRSVWRDIRPEPYHGDHYAVFPPDLPRLCIQCSTSDVGVCPSCGSQWARVVHKQPSTMNIRVRDAKKGILTRKSGFDRNATDEQITSYGTEKNGETRTVNWRPTCECGERSSVPATVLDPFVGTGTTCLAAQRLGRRSVGVDLSPSYLDQAVKRVSEISLPLMPLHDDGHPDRA